MSILIALELEGLPPTVNLLYRNRGHIRYKTTAGREYQENVVNRLRESWTDCPPYELPIKFQITFETKDKRRWDIDNRVKVLQDCLSMAGVIKDDRQVEILHVERKYGTKNVTYIEVESKS